MAARFKQTEHEELGTENLNMQSGQIVSVQDFQYIIDTMTVDAILTSAAYIDYATKHEGKTTEEALEALTEFAGELMLAAEAKAKA